MNFGLYGIEVHGSSDFIIDNYLGTSNGITAAPNGNGLLVGTGAEHTEIRGNLISGNLNSGIDLDGDENFVLGNRIGTDAAGRTELANGGAGIVVVDGINQRIGGELPADRNLISGNIGPGIEVNAQGTSIFGNFIGTDAAGTSAVGNTGGIVVDGVDAVGIGGSVPGMGNLISGNFGNGITLVNGAQAQIDANFIGTNAAGTASVGNTTHGVEVDNSALAPLGGTVDTRNVISGNSGYGVFIHDHAGLGAVSTVNVNYIGTNVDGTAAIPNAVGVVLTDADGQSIGVQGFGSIISGNSGPGILVNGTSSGNEIVSNRIGLNFASDVAIPNGDAGIYLDAPSTGTIVGGDTDLNARPRELDRRQHAGRCGDQRVERQHRPGQLHRCDRRARSTRQR